MTDKIKCLKCGCFYDKPDPKQTNHADPQICDECKAGIRSERRIATRKKKNACTKDRLSDEKLARQNSIKKIAKSIDSPKIIIKAQDPKQLLEACQAFADSKTRREVNDMIGDC